MRLLVVGKFPPIEGGVSGHTFWLATALATQGHEVHVVTNASEVEPTFAQLHYGTDAETMRPSAGGGGRLRIHETTAVETASFIPFAQPHASKLLGLALSVAEEHDVDAIFGWYLEPYGVVAAMAGVATGRRTVLRHAGSDLGRLAHHPELALAYRWAVRAADALVVTNEPEFEARLGSVSTPRLRPARPRLPEAFAGAEPLELGPLLEAAPDWFARTGLPAALIDAVLELNAKPFPAEAFVLGAYGKVGPSKGSFDLLAALERTPAELAFISCACGRPETLRRYWETITSSPALARRTWILPPIAPWRVPSLLRRCHAVCFLERGFPIGFHGPLVPREILSSGACLVVSGEIAAKPLYRGNLVNARNAIVVPDPRDHVDLSVRIDALARDPVRARSIGDQGRHLLRFMEEDLHGFSRSAAMFAAQLAEG